MLKVLTDAGLTEGTIGIVDAQAGVDSCENRYQGFASVFEGTDFTLGERQYSDGDNINYRIGIRRDGKPGCNGKKSKEK